MTIQEAISHERSCYGVRRTGWKPNCHLIRGNKMPASYSNHEVPEWRARPFFIYRIASGANVFVFSDKDLLANDWEVNTLDIFKEYERAYKEFYKPTIVKETY